MGSKTYSQYLSSSQLFLYKKVNNNFFVLLQRRKGGWADKMWEAGASGHVDHGESPTDAIIHEAFEEICVKIKERDLKFIGVIHKTIGGKEHAYYNFSFMCTKWKGIPKIGEPEKASELKWFNIKKLPMNIISDRKKVLRQYAKGIYYTNVNESKKVRNYLFKKSS